jgi:hypothetical protein
VNDVDFLWAVGEIKAGRGVQRKVRIGGRLIVKSIQQAWVMGPGDFMAEDWESYTKPPKRRKVE